MEQAEEGLQVLQVDLLTQQATLDLGAKIGALCKGGECLLLAGELGAGKTRWTQGLAQGLQVPASYAVTSPTFVLHAAYPGRVELHHIDLYRLADPVAVPDLGFEELFGDPACVCVVEWAEYLGPYAPSHAFHLELTIIGPQARHLTGRCPASHAHLLPAFCPGK